MNAPDHWQSLTPAKRMEMEKHARSLVRGSIIEDAASRFMAMCMAEAIGESTRRADLAPAAPKVKALVWQDFDGQGAKASGFYQANYLIALWRGKGKFEVSMSYPGYQTGFDGERWHDTIEAAKAAAQADYEARILAALEGGDA